MHLGLQLMNAYKDFYLQHNVYKWVVSCILIITLTWLPESAMGTDKAMIQTFAFYLYIFKTKTKLFNNGLHWKEETMSKSERITRFTHKIKHSTR